MERISVPKKLVDKYGEDIVNRYWPRTDLMPLVHIMTYGGVLPVPEVSEYQLEAEEKSRIRKAIADTPIHMILLSRTMDARTGEIN